MATLKEQLEAAEAKLEAEKKAREAAEASATKAAEEAAQKAAEAAAEKEARERAEKAARDAAAREEAAEGRARRAERAAEDAEAAAESAIARASEIETPAEEEVEAEAMVYARLAPRDPNMGHFRRAYSVNYKGKPYRWKAGEVCPIPAGLADHLETVRDKHLKGTPRGAACFEITDEKPGA